MDRAKAAAEAEEKNANLMATFGDVLSCIKDTMVALTAAISAPIAPAARVPVTPRAAPSAPSAPSPYAPSVSRYSGADEDLSFNSAVWDAEEAETRAEADALMRDLMGPSWSPVRQRIRFQKPQEEFDPATQQ